MNADKIFGEFCNNKAVINIMKESQGDNKTEEYYLKAIEFFDIFLMYGRIFENKQIRESIKEVLQSNIECSQNIRYSISKIMNFLIKLMDEPEKNLSSFSVSLISIAIQGILVPTKIRLPENSNLFINTLSNCLLHRGSSFYKFLEVIVNDFNGDRWNREFITISEYSEKNEENNLMFGSLYIVSEMNKFYSNKAGRDHTYQNLTIADLEAEYINVPIHLIFYWIKKVFYSFISQTICLESINEIPIYTESDLISNKHYNEVLLSQYIKHDYLLSLNLYAINMGIIYKTNYGSLKRTLDKSKIEESSNSQLKWYVDLYNKMLQNKNLAKIFSSRLGSKFHFYKNDHLSGKILSKTLNKKLNIRNEKVIETTRLNLDLLEGIQKSMLNELNQADFDILMQRGYQALEHFIDHQSISDSDQDPTTDSRFNILIN